MASDDPEVRRVMKEDLKKKRLAAVAGHRLERWKELAGSRGGDLGGRAPVKAGRRVRSRPPAIGI